jgi:hypothetical protein
MVLYDPDYGAALCPACHGKATANPKAARVEIVKRIRLARYQYRSQFQHLLAMEYEGIPPFMDDRAAKLELLDANPRLIQTAKPRWTFVQSMLTIDLMDAQQWALDNQGCTPVFRPITEAEKAVSDERCGTKN